MTTSLSSEQVIRRLYQITSDHQKGLNLQILDLLAMGLDGFGLDIAILSKIEQNTYSVELCITPDDVEMNSGDQFDFAATFCDITCKAQGPVALEHVGEHHQHSSHPAYQAFGLESYIGIPIHVNGTLYGTLNFSSHKPFPRKFRDIDIEALTLMASWIEVELTRREQEFHLNALNYKLEQQANYDSLTNILNRRGMYVKLKENFNQLSRKNSDCIVAIIDIDHFKKLNDTYGHQKGDEALIKIAKSISDTLRNYEFIARIGGEEFLVWLPNTDQEASAVVLQRIMDTVSAVSISTETITISIGACYFSFSQNQSTDFTVLIDELIAKADSALYEAKNQGRNRFVYYAE